jgi:hypothetical protein
MADETVDAAHAFLRANLRGDLRFDEHVRGIRFVIAPDGRLVAPVMVAMLEAVDCVLNVPAIGDDAMELHVSLEPFEEHGPGGAFADRWRIYHGEPEDVRWALLTIDAARYGGIVIDGEALMIPNPLAPHEPRLLKLINQRPPDALRQIVRRARQIDIEEPRAVGIDPGGLDIRARFGVVRVMLAPSPATAAEAERALTAMVNPPAPPAARSPG